MAYSAAILARAKARLAAAREQNAQDDAARIGAIYERLPRLRQIDLELQKTAAKVCAAAFRAGEDPSETIRQLKDENLRLQQERDWILESEGVDPDDLEQTAVCPRCGGSGYLGARMCECLAELCRQEQKKELSTLLGAGRDFDLDAVRHGKLSPVFFGSALTNFGVEPFLNAFLEMTTPPLPRVSDAGEVDVYSPEFSAFVFKIQANMNKAHRDRLAFMRICSGRFERDTEYFHVQSGRKMRLSQPQTMMAAEREIVDEAYAGDIIGVFDPGIFSIGDTITMPGKKFRFSGIPTFEPEHFMLVSPKDTMKRKQFVKGVEQIAQEGAIQIFKIPDSGFEDVVVGVVGTLQFDVFEYRMKNEYGVDLRMSGLPYEHLRLIRECPCDVKDLMLCSGSRVLEDFKGRKLIAFGGEWSVGFLTKHNEGLILDDWLSV